MPPDDPSDAERAALLRFEALYEAWRVANERAMKAEQQLWLESLGSITDERRRALAAEAVRLRGIAQEAYKVAIAARPERD